jgi:isopentenyl phosphate kinase
MSGKGAVIKLGGSVLTDKSRTDLALDEPLVSRLGRELSSLDCRPLVLVHGAGSFGHQIVHRTGIHRGLAGPESLRHFGETQRLVSLLSTQVTELLLEAGLSAMPIQASASAIMAGGRLESMDLQAVELMLAQGLVPVFYGVPAVDREQGCSILSGDVIAATVAVKLGIPLLVHVTRTDGVFDSDPERHPEALRIERIDRENWDQVRPLLAGSSGVDVTGGMAGKVGSLLALAQSGLMSRIVSAHIPGRIASALRGEAVGTLVVWAGV